MSDTGDDPGARRWLPVAGLAIGLTGFAVIVTTSPPEGLSSAAWYTAATTWLMACWWLTEAIPIAATALVPLCALPLLGVSDMATAARPYGSDIIFLAMGGFMLAIAMQRCQLHRRIALSIVARVGTQPRRLVLGFMLASAFLSMWISNTATTAMMLPIAIAVAQMFRPHDRVGTYEFGICLLLGVAYGATIGGVSTLIGTPPNAVFAAAAVELLDVQIGFFDWMLVGVPVAAVFLPATWLVLTGWLYPPGTLRGDAAALFTAERRAQGPPTRTERAVALVFALTALAWVFRAPKQLGGWELPGLQTWLPEMRDSTIAVLAALVLFCLPGERPGQRALDWKAATALPWEVIVLFGGGLSLATAMNDTGLAAWIGSGVAGLGTLPPWLMFALVAALFVFLTEITSNLATCAMAMPIMAGTASGLGVPAVTLMAAAALSTSMAFMLPVATPPNAIVYGSGYVGVRDLMRAGVWLNAAAVALVTAAALWLLPALQ